MRSKTEFSRTRTEFTRTMLTAAATLAVILGLLAVPTTAAAESPPDLENPQSIDVPGMAGIDGEITRLYLALLDREPDLGGLQFWVAQRRDGVDLREVAAHFHHSPEFADRFGHLLDADAGTWVDLLYERILGRAPDAGGRAFWVDRVESGAMSREELIVHFSESTEFQVATHTGLPGLLQLVAESELAYAGLDDDYTYRSSDWAFWTGPETTTIEVADGVVVTRSFERDHPLSGSETWSETGAEIGSHAEGAPALTVPEVHDACRDILREIDRTFYHLVVEVDDDGRLTLCGGLEYLLADGGNEIVAIEGLQS